MVLQQRDLAHHARHRYYERLEASRQKKKNKKKKKNQARGVSPLPSGKSFPSFLFPTYMRFDVENARRGLLKGPLVLAVSASASIENLMLIMHAIGLPAYLDGS